MVASKKKVGQVKEPRSRVVEQSSTPESFYKLYPSWNFNMCDCEKWCFDRDNAGDLIWSEILPHLKSLETQTWSQILIDGKNQNHSIDVVCLNKAAQSRLVERYIEAESIISLRLTATHRIYGYVVGSAFNILWFDKNHGDNAECVCRAIKKHT